MYQFLISFVVTTLVFLVFLPLVEVASTYFHYGFPISNCEKVNRLFNNGTTNRDTVKKLDPPDYSVSVERDMIFVYGEHWGISYISYHNMVFFHQIVIKYNSGERSIVKKRSPLYKKIEAVFDKKTKEKSEIFSTKNS